MLALICAKLATFEEHGCLMAFILNLSLLRYKGIKISNPVGIVNHVCDMYVTILGGSYAFQHDQYHNLSRPSLTWRGAIPYSLWRTMACFHVISLSVNSIGDHPVHVTMWDHTCAYYFVWRSPLCIIHYVEITPVHTTLCEDHPCAHYFYVPWFMTSQWIMILLVTSIMTSQWVVILLCVDIMAS